ncbi:MAG: glycerol-3-phosphate dehydrogenase/oxidase [Deltaproteobacteria bacterium]|nr:glycerol-3-phosphate dehydrogenase/oxidase [Deltaproteobacteria bacterium]
MDRQMMIDALSDDKQLWDVVVIGGGATGLGVAIDAVTRGYKTVLLEQDDFSKGTSSRSTKLVHGGVRYLKQGNLSLVLEALHERGIMIQNAPHLISNQAFIVPNYDWWEGPFYGIGMKVYDMLAGRLGLRPSRNLSVREVLKRIPTLEPKGLRGGVIYYDGQFDDSRLAVNMAQTVADYGGIPLNYTEVIGLLKKEGAVAGVSAKDVETGEIHHIAARVVVNATGAFVDGILRMDDPQAAKIVTPSQGVHLIVDKKFLPGRAAIMVPHTDDGRVLFAVPWHNKVILGTTDTQIDEVSLEPRAMEEEIDFILTHACRYLSQDPERKDVLSVFAGIRPLIKMGDDKSTAELSRDHNLFISPSGLVTITGGKWTTYRKMAQDTIDQAAVVAGLERRPCVTENMRIHGWLKNINPQEPLGYYGSDVLRIRRMIDEAPALGERLYKDLPYLKAEVVWAVRNEMARTIEDVLSRRTRALLLNARASMEMAPVVAELMAAELKKNKTWQKKQVAAYRKLAAGYLPALKKEITD